MIALLNNETGKTALRYKRQICSIPWNQVFEVQVHKDIFTAKVTSEKTRQVWTLVFQRQPNGRFVPISETGEFCN